MKVINPEFRPHQALAKTDVEWDALKAKITAELRSQAANATVDLAVLRRLDAAFNDDLIWNQIISDLQLTILPDP